MPKIRNSGSGVGELAHHAKVAVSRSDDLSLTSGTRMIEGTTNSHKLSSDLHTHTVARVSSYK